MAEGGIRPRAANGGADTPEPDTPMEHYPERMSGEPAAGPGTFPAFKEGAWMRRRFGLSQRAWLALAVVFGFLVLTKIVVRE